MITNFVDELRWRGMIQDITPGTEEQLAKEMTAAYVGFDPTADSLHVGSLIPIMLLMHAQRAGHKPIALVGGATGMIGDPSFKADERKLLDEETLQKNIVGISKQLSMFLDFNSGNNKAELVNNYDWMKEFSFIGFIRDIGKHISVNYMMSKDSVKKRLETGISFTEFSYQLLQGYDFLHLYREKNCLLQMGGSDQWGNITTGTELVRRVTGGSAFAFTCPLLTKSDGGKFGKTESGTVWLDPNRTSPYEFYQFWLNASDQDASKLIRLFTFCEKSTIEDLERQHAEAPHLRILQEALAKDITIRLHGAEEYEMAVAASRILFGKSTADDLKRLSEKQFLEIFNGVQQATISRNEFEEGIGIIDALSAKTGFLKSNGEARRDLQSNAISVNKEKVGENYTLNHSDLINDKFILLGKGKKTNFIIVVE